MRILLVGINYAPDLVGVPKYNTELCETLVAAGHEVRVITAPPYYPAWKVPAEHRDLYFRRHTLNGVRIRRVPIFVPRRPGGLQRLIHHGSFALSSAAAVMRHAVLWRPHVMFAVAPSLLSAALVAAAARRVGAKSWLHVQDFEVEAAFDLGLLRSARLRQAMASVERRILLAFDRVSSISPPMLSRLAAKGVSEDCIREFRNWIDTDGIGAVGKDTSFRKELGLPEDAFVALYSGTMSNKQGLDLILSAAASLETTAPRVHFLLAGGGPYRENLMSMAQGRQNVHFLELQPIERFPELLATADVHLVPQRAEAADLVLPSKLGGIFASRRPLIAMAATGTGLANEVNGCGLIIPPGDAVALAESIVHLLHHPQVCAELGENGRRRALDRWDRGSVINHFIDDLHVLLKEENSAKPRAEGGLKLDVREGR